VRQNITQSWQLEPKTANPNPNHPKKTNPNSMDLVSGFADEKYHKVPDRPNLNQPNAKDPTK